MNIKTIHWSPSSPQHGNETNAIKILYTGSVQLCIAQSTAMILISVGIPSRLACKLLCELSLTTYISV